MCIQVAWLLLACGGCRLLVVALPACIGHSTLRLALCSVVVVFIAVFLDMSNCLIALDRIGLRGLCFSEVVVFIDMQQLSLDVMDRAQTRLLALLGCFCLTLH